MKQKNCFVIMPFSSTTSIHTENYWNDFYSVIREEMELQNYICNRSETGPHNILKDVINNLYESDFVIAVLTDKNPNVWYELGIRHSLSNGTLMLIEDGQKIEFDISGYGLIKYNDDISLATKLRKGITTYLSKLKLNKYFDSPVLDFLELPARHKDIIEEVYELVVKIANEKSTNKINKFMIQESSNIRILWVDDYPINNKQVIELFESKNVKFDIAISTNQGINLARDYEYDLIITDMGRGNEPDAGLKFIKKVKKIELNNKTTTIVFSSISAIRKYGSVAIELGALANLNGFGEIISFISRYVEKE